MVSPRPRRSDQRFASPFKPSMGPPRTSRAGVARAKIEAGQTVTVKWRGKPVFIEGRRVRGAGGGGGRASLRDPQADADRAVNPEWMVLVGVCTHLGCVPISNAGDYNGWFCPCHGSHYDASGRIRKGPAPYNLEVPEYKFMDGDKMVIG